MKVQPQRQRLEPYSFINDMRDFFSTSDMTFQIPRNISSNFCTTHHVTTIDVTMLLRLILIINIFHHFPKSRQLRK